MNRTDGLPNGLKICPTHTFARGGGFGWGIPLLSAVLLTACAGATAPGGGTPDLSACNSPNCMPAMKGCTSDALCTNANRPHCDVPNTTCVQCLKDDQCDAGQLCNLGSHTCAPGCSANRACASDGGQCEADAGLCVECLADGDCVDPNRTRCDQLSHKCGVCNPVNDNCGYATYCDRAMNGGSYACLPGCKVDPDCRPQAMPPPDGGDNGDGGQNSDGGMPLGGLPYCDATRHACAQCIADVNCPLGQICKADVCVPGCTGQHACNNVLACCGMPGNQQCIDTKQDFLNCGGCGIACMGGFLCCSSACADPVNDVTNCGSCGKVCMTKNGIAGCVARQCSIATCNAGWAHCQANGNDCETHTDINPSNCGSCGNVCIVANGFPKCVAGMCQVGSCLMGYGDCNMNPMDGCETLLTNDPKNCNGCGIVCSGNHISQPTCGNVMGNVICKGTCDTGFLDCNMDKQKDGCEVDQNNDVANCGACGNACAAQCVANVAAKGTSCASGACSITAMGCKAGYYDIDGKCANGCECLSAPAAGTCGVPNDLGALAPGLGKTAVAKGNFVGMSTEAWYRITFTDDLTASSYSPTILIDGAGEFLFDVYGACGGPSLDCSDGNPGTGRIQWDTYYKKPDAMGSYDPVSPGFLPIVAVGAAGTVLIHVYRPGGKPVTCNTYTLTLSNG